MSLSKSFDFLLGSHCLAVCLCINKSITLFKLCLCLAFGFSLSCHPTRKLSILFYHLWSTGTGTNQTQQRYWHVSTINNLRKWEWLSINNYMIKHQHMSNKQTHLQPYTCLCRTGSNINTCQIAYFPNFPVYLNCVLTSNETEN